MPDPVTPAAPANGVAAPAPVAPDPLKAAQDEAQRHKRDAIDFRRRLEVEKKEKATLGQKLSEYETLKKEKAARDAEYAAEKEKWTRREAQMKAAFGDKYSELVPDNLTPADVERMLKQRDEAYAAQREAEKKKEQEAQLEARKEADRQARAELRERTVQFLEKSADDYPVFKGKPHMAEVLAERIEARWRASGGKEILTAKEAADGLEKEMLDLRDELNKHAKYAAKAAAVAEPQSKSSVGGQSRLVPTNDLTGSTSAPKPKRSEKDRLAAADAVFREKHKG